MGGARRAGAAVDVGQARLGRKADRRVGRAKKLVVSALEDLEKEARGWYGGAVGMLSLNGYINTGILIRTVHLRDGIARYSAGATLLYDSVPELEEQETRLKATGFFRSLRGVKKGDPTGGGGG